MKSLAEMKKGRKSNFEKLKNKVDELSKGNNYNDDRIWKCNTDANKNGFAIIRFLPPPKGEDLAWSQLWTHGFQNKDTGRYYIENCLTSIGQEDPVCQANNDLWNTGLEANKDIAKDRKRRLEYYTNIYVVKDSHSPQNEGKVFLFRFGMKIFDKIKQAMHPEYEDEVAINPFDFWEGANFKLKIRQVAGYANYDKSEFEDVSPLSKIVSGEGESIKYAPLSDDELDEVWGKQHSLAEFLAPSNYKSYDELKKKFDTIVNGSNSDVPATAEEADEEPEHKSIEETLSKEESSEPEIKDEIDEDIEEDDEFAKLKELAL